VARISSSASGPGAAAPLPTLIHGRVRLLVLSRLMSRPGGYAFTELRDLLQLTDGSLSVHLGKLEAGRLVEIRKEFVGKKPRTLVRMTATGRQRFRDYVADLRRIVPGLEPPE
jgi:DNA-binding transcriptional ArsR family regulator